MKTPSLQILAVLALILAGCKPAPLPSPALLASQTPAAIGTQTPPLHPGVPSPTSPSPALARLSFEHKARARVGDHPTSIVSGDFDRDGDLDFAIANDGDGQGKTVSIVINDRPQHFS